MVDGETTIDSTFARILFFSRSRSGFQQNKAAGQGLLNSKQTCEKYHNLRRSKSMSQQTVGCSDLNAQRELKVNLLAINYCASLNSGLRSRKPMRMRGGQDSRRHICGSDCSCRPSTMKAAEIDGRMKKYCDILAASRTNSSQTADG